MMQWTRECTDYTIHLIRAVMNEQAVPEIPESVTLEQVYGYAKFHNIESLVYHGLCQLDVAWNNSVWQDWENRVSMLLAQGVVQLADRDVLFGELTEAGIPVLPVKGCWMKEWYPNMEYRQMADLDMLIPREKSQQAKELMLSLGYQTEAFEDAPNHAGFLKPPYTEVELHIGLLPEDDGYYDDVWSRAVRVEGYPCLYRLKPEDEYIYYLLHLNKHFEDAGTGIRSILDSIVFRRVFPDMDWDYVNQEVQKIKLAELAEAVDTIAQCWFCTGEPVPEQLESMEASILYAGSYGNLETRSRQRLNRLEQRYKNALIRGIAYWIIQTCRPLKEMSVSFPVLEKLPVLLPLFWIYRAVMKFANNPKKIWHHIKLVFGRKTHND